jgi:hypothetical protein
MTKHTPGPWAYGLIEPGCPKTGFTVNDYCKGGLYLELAVGNGTPEELAQGEANARLIAAAPEMAAALEAIKAITKEEDNPKREQRLFRIYEIALAALSKAEGR